jgi:hypothetical protein
MKIWSSEHIFNHSWDNVIKAQINKYPNPLNPGVIGIDVIERRIEQHTISSHRLFITKWNIPEWFHKVIGGNPICYASEHSHIDRENKEFSLRSRNITLNNIISIEEKLTYTVHPQDTAKTLLRQEAQITVSNMPLISYMESLLANTINSNANKGRQAIEYIIHRMSDIKDEAEKSVEAMKNTAKANHVF